MSDTRTSLPANSPSQSPMATLIGKLQRGEVSPQQFEAEVTSLNGNGRAAGLQLSRNCKGGLFLRDPSITAWSEAKNKRYVVSVNLPWEAACSLFGADATLRDSVCKFVQAEA